MTDFDKSLIEDYLPISEISDEASKEKAARKGHFSTMHLWWARRPLAACRANVFGLLVRPSLPLNKIASGQTEPSREGDARFVAGLCTYPVPKELVEQAEQLLLNSHAEMLSRETGTRITPDDIRANAKLRPRVLDPFAGGGAIPLEALRLGCDVSALDLNPVAHLIELCALVYPQKYGFPDPTKRGSAENGSWAGLSKELRHWGERLLRNAWNEISDLYRPISASAAHGELALESGELWDLESKTGGKGNLTPVAYLWTRAVPCKQPGCGANVPLVRQTWLCKRSRHYVALKASRPSRGENLRFEVVEANTEEALGFDPEAGSARGNAICGFCGAVADNAYIKAVGQQKRFSVQLLAVACRDPQSSGKTYVSGDEVSALIPTEAQLEERLAELSSKTGLNVPDEPLPKQGTLGFRVQPYGFNKWGDLFTKRQKLMLLTVAANVLETEQELRKLGYTDDHVVALTTYLGLLQSTISNSNSSICRWIPQNQQMGSTFSRQALPMTWDFVEIAPFGGGSGDTREYLERQIEAIEAARVSPRPAHVSRGSATSLPWAAETFDAVITDPPYYDNVPYADLSDFFYVWLRRTLGHLHKEHFSSPLTPKKFEAIAEPARFGGSRELATASYEQMLRDSFREASRVLKSTGKISVIYAHKTTLGWTTLVDALRQAGFMVTEAWPLDTEKPGRLRALDSAALASSIILIGRKRRLEVIGDYENEVRGELEGIVRERVNSLWDLGILGADLVISCVAAGLRAFTKYPAVQYGNGEDVPAERFLAEVENVVLDTILGKLSEKVASGNPHVLSGLDAETRFYVLWRYTYKTAELESGEAIIFANGTHVELDGPRGLSQGQPPLIEKNKGRYRLLDFTERGKDARLGLASHQVGRAPVVDVLHRLLWLMEYQPNRIPDFLAGAKPDLEQVQLVAQALAGPALKGSELDEVASGRELTTLTKLSSNWNVVVEEALPNSGPLFRATAKS